MTYICIYIDNELKKKWASEPELPKHFLMKCHKLLHVTQNFDESTNHVRCLFSKGVLLLVNSCRHCRATCCDDVLTVCHKLLYLSNLFYNRFGEMIVEDKDLVSNCK